jgi:hypothetical protein
MVGGRGPRGSGRGLQQPGNELDTYLGSGDEPLPTGTKVGLPIVRVINGVIGATRWPAKGKIYRRNAKAMIKDRVVGARPQQASGRDLPRGGKQSTSR